MKKWIGAATTKQRRVYTLSHGSVGTIYGGNRYTLSLPADLAPQTVIDTFVTAVEAQLIEAGGGDSDAEHTLVRGDGPCPQTDDMLLRATLKPFWARFTVSTDDTEAKIERYLLFHTNKIGHFSVAINTAIANVLKQIETP